MKCAYFDESSNSEVFLIAGWIADLTEWQRFNDQWQATLAESPPISRFKHHEAMSFEGDFLAWTEKERDEKVMALAGVLVNFDVWGIVGGVKLPTFNAAFKNCIASKKELRNILRLTEPYEFCFHGIVAAVLQQVAANCSEPVDFIFDQQSGLGRNCIDLYQEFKDNPEKYSWPPEIRAIAGSIIESTDDETPPIQAADLLAGQVVLNLKLGSVPEPLKMLAGSKRIYKFASFPPGFHTWEGMIQMLNVLLKEKADLKQLKGLLVRQGKWDLKEGWD